MNAEPDAAPENGESSRSFKLLEKLSFAGVLAGGAALVMITLIVTYDVIVRFMGSPTIWATEISGYLLMAVAVLGAAEALRRNEHFAMTLLVDALGTRTRQRVALIVWILVFLLVAGVVSGMVDLIVNSLRYNLRSYTIVQAPLALPQTVLLLGFLALALALVGRVVALVRRLREPEGPE
jgi:TRAP-type C4-dicarboxylate transport system permease small subunit